MKIPLWDDAFMIVPYKLLRSCVQSEHDTVSLPRSAFEHLLSLTLTLLEIDEERYLKVNPDVAASVRQGHWKSGKDHYTKEGYFEDRHGALEPVDEAWYLRANPDVANAVKTGEWSSAESHFHQRGIFEWRAPNSDAQDVFSTWKMVLVDPSAEVSD